MTWLTGGQCRSCYLGQDTDNVTKGTIMRGLGLFGSLKFWIVASLLLIGQPAFAEKRVALVLGNSAYQNVPRLTNPVNDAALMAETFKKAGFDVVV